MNVERMEHGIAVLRQVILHRLPFYMGDWIEDDGSASGCNTAACAAGWMCRDPWMKAQGLEYDLEPVYEGRDGFEAMAEFLGISYHEVRHLFAPEHYLHDRISDITPDMVMNRMRAMLAANVEDVTPAEAVAA